MEIDYGMLSHLIVDIDKNNILEGSRARKKNLIPGSEE